MATLHIRRCTVRVVRRGGWGWGADRDRLLAGVLAELRALLERVVGDLAVGAPSEAPRVVTTPLQIRVPVTRAEFAALIEQHGDGEAAALSAVRAIAEARVRDAIVDAIGALPADARAPRPERVTAEELAETSSSSVTGMPHVGAEPRHALRRTLSGLFREGELGAFLASLPMDVLEQWHSVLALAPSTPVEAARDAVERAHVALGRSFVRPLPASAPRRRRLARWLYAFAVLDSADAPRLPPPARAAAMAVFAIGDGMPPSEPSAPDDSGMTAARANTVDEETRPSVSQAPIAASAPPLGRSAGPAPRSPTPREAVTLRDPPQSGTPPAEARRREREVAAPAHPGEQLDGEHRIDCALPYLVLGPLARLGWLDALAAGCVGRRDDPLPLLARGLAMAVLAPPERGWRRAEGVTRTAAVFAGRDGIDDAALAALVPSGEALLGPARSMLARRLIRGHAPRRGLVLRRAAAGWWLFEAEGLFLLSLSNTLPALFGQIGPMPPTRVAVPVDTFDAEVAGAIVSDGHTWVSDAPPGRGESPRALRRGSLRVWTSDASGPAAPLYGIGRAMSDNAIYADDVIDALTRRPAIARAAETSLALALTHAASVGLAAMAHTLYRERETPTPVLALRRFADLSASVRFGVDAVVVTLPLGARTRHLRDSGLLDPIEAVPWLGGRRIELRGG